MSSNARLSRTLVLYATFAVACAPAVLRPPRVIEPAAASIETAAPAAGDYEAAFAAIVSVFERRLDLPRPDVRLLLFPDRRSFEAGLLQGGNPPDAARRIAETFQAVGTANAVFANEGSFHGMSWRARVQLIAHELVHCVQYRLGGGRRGTSEQWLREGFAELISIRVVEALSLSRPAALREEWRQILAAELGRNAMPPRRVPLAGLSTFAEWTDAQARHGPAMYVQALEAADALVTQHGYIRVAEYFGMFADSQDREANFLRAFGRSLDDFDREFEAHWQAVLAQTRAGS